MTERAMFAQPLSYIAVICCIMLSAVHLQCGIELHFTPVPSGSQSEPISYTGTSVVLCGKFQCAEVESAAIKAAYGSFFSTASEYASRTNSPVTDVYPYDILSQTTGFISRENMFLAAQHFLLRREVSTKPGYSDRNETKHDRVRRGSESLVVTAGITDGDKCCPTIRRARFYTTLTSITGQTSYIIHLPALNRYQYTTVGECGAYGVIGRCISAMYINMAKEIYHGGGCDRTMDSVFAQILFYKSGTRR